MCSSPLNSHRLEVPFISLRQEISLGAITSCHGNLVLSQKKGARGLCLFGGAPLQYWTYHLGSRQWDALERHTCQKAPRLTLTCVELPSLLLNGDADCVL